MPNHATHHAARRQYTRASTILLTIPLLLAATLTATAQTTVTQHIQVFAGHTEAVSSVAFSPDGSRVLTGSYDYTTKLWDADTGLEIRTFAGHTETVNSVAFSPDGTRVLTGAWDNTAKLWDADTGLEIRTFAGHTNLVLSVAFSPDGTRILTGSLDYTAKLWGTDGTDGEGELPASLQGRITDVADNPITCATVVVTNEFAEEFLATVDLDGNYIFEALPAGTYLLEVFAANFDTGLIDNLDLAQGDNVTRDLVLEPGPTEGLIRGVVTDVENGQFLGGARVEVFDADILVGITFSCADGSYEVALNLTKQTGGRDLTLLFTAPNYEPFTEEVTLDPGQVLQVSAAMQFALTIKGQLVGTVSDDTGPLTNARVTADFDNQFSRSTSTDALGEYILLNLEPGTCQVTASYEGLESATTQVSILEAGVDAEANFTLADAPSGGEGEGEGEGPVKGGCGMSTSSAPWSGLAGDIMLLAAVVLLILGSRHRATKHG